MNNKTTIYVVRHGQSEFNATLDLDTIPLDGEFGAHLSNIGKNQAKELTQKLENVKFAAIFSSDLARARETAEILALEKKIAVETTKTLRERDIVRYAMKLGYKSFVEIEDRLRNEIKNLNEEAKMNFKHTPEMESPNEAATRLLTFIRETAVAYAGQTIMIVCHSNLMRCLLNHLGYAKFDELMRGSVKNTAYFVLESDGVDFIIKETSGIQKINGEKRPF